MNLMSGEVINELEMPTKIPNEELDKSNHKDETAYNRYMLPEFTEIVSMMHPNIEFPDCLKNMYETDSFFQKVI